MLVVLLEMAKKPSRTSKKVPHIGKKSLSFSTIPDLVAKF